MTTQTEEPPVLAASTEPANSPFADRDIRQRGLLPPDMLSRVRAHVIGVGAIGRQAALQLAAVGVGRMFLYDDDTVGVENLSAQGFMEVDLGKPKVQAVGDMVHATNSAIEVRAEPNRFQPDRWAGTVADRDPEAGIHDVVFCCVDSIDTRKRIFDVVYEQASLFIDARMAVETLFVYTVLPEIEEQVLYYNQTIFPSSEAYRGACTAKSTIYTANVAAGLMVSEFSKWVRGMPTAKMINLSLFTTELSVDYSDA